MRNYKFSLFDTSLKFLQNDKEEIISALNHYPSKKLQIKLVEMNDDYFEIEVIGEVNKTTTSTISRYLKRNCAIGHLYSAKNKRLFTTTK